MTSASGHLQILRQAGLVGTRVREPGCTTDSPDQMWLRCSQRPGMWRRHTPCTPLLPATPTHDAVRLLTAQGRRAVRLMEGMLEWRLADLPVATTTP